MRMFPKSTPARPFALLALLAVAVVLHAPVRAGSPGDAASTMPGLVEPMLSPAFWIDRLDAPDAPLLDRAGIAAQDARMRRLDNTLHDPLALPRSLDRAAVTARIAGLSARPSQPRYTVDGALDAAALDALESTLALDAIPESVTPRTGLVLRRADLRAFPTSQPVFSRPGDTAIDRFQEDALFPGAPVAVLHTSRDGAWYFVVSERYTAWIERAHVVLGPHETVAAYVARAAKGLVVTGATARTVHTPEVPAVSDVQLEMGVRVPRLDWPADTPLNGQLPGYGYVVELPVRGDDGALAFAPAAIPRAADVATDVLPLTRAHLIGQAFKFLGERYGWGHRYNARDCSGFVSEIYRSVGVLLPRNTSAQSVSPALDRIEVAPGTPYAQRLQLLRDADVGDMVFIPGHVMLVIGHVDGEPWVIHDTAGTHLREPDGTIRRQALNGVVVTPMTPLLADADGTRMIDRITSIQRVR